MINECLICGNPFYTKPARIKDGRGKFCSRNCYAINRVLNYRDEKHPNWKGGISKIKKERKIYKTETSCLFCNKRFPTFISEILKGHSKFCSRKCHGKWKSIYNTGSNHPNWLGDKVGYTGSHTRVKKKFGKPSRCDICGTTRKDIVYEWANLTGNFHDINDFRRMCRSCHRKYDYKRNPRTKKE